VALLEVAVEEVVATAVEVVEVPAAVPEVAATVVARASVPGTAPCVLVDRSHRSGSFLDRV